LADFYKKLGYKNFKIPGFLAMIFSLATYIVIFWVIGKMMNSNIQEVIALLPKYQERLSSLYIQGLNYFQIPPTIDAYSVFQKIDIATQFTNVVSSITSIFSNAGLIFFYVVFILLEYRFFSEKIQLMFKTPQKRTTAIELIDRIKGDIKSYFLIKTIVSFTTASIAYLFMVLF
jgi:predicted PurR-regulated permease PerM